ncbi:MAG: MarR family winged helix-turn-helix transcriptional regulator [Desulfovibrionaceae bacterium]
MAQSLHDRSPALARAPGSELSPDQTPSFPQALAEAARAWRARMDARLRPLGLSHAMWMVISCLARKDCALTQRELAQAVGVEGPTLVRLLDRLEDGGWARRVADPEDRRVKRVELTDKARPCFADMCRTDDAVRRELLGDLPSEEVTTAHKVLLAIREHL